MGRSFLTLAGLFLAIFHGHAVAQGQGNDAMVAQLEGRE